MQIRRKVVFDSLREFDRPEAFMAMEILGLEKKPLWIALGLWGQAIVVCQAYSRKPPNVSPLVGPRSQTYLHTVY